MLLFKKFIHHIRLKINSVILLSAFFFTPFIPLSGSPLFESDDLLHITVEAPLKTLLNQRSSATRYETVEIPYLDGTLTYEREGQDSVVLNIRVKARGHTRRMREVCDFPPIWVDFEKPKVKETVFEGQNKLKLVTHCSESGTAFEQIVLKEYLSYRTYNLLTERSFRARLAKVTYIDSVGRRKAITRYGFFIEDEKKMANRNCSEKVRVNKVSREMYEATTLNLLEIYEFMIGNLDFSLLMAEPGSRCCHNARLISHPEIDNLLLPIPYDFDHAGIVAAPYARPPKSLNMRSVKQRLYRGYCHSDGILEANIEFFNAQKKDILNLWQNAQGLNTQTRKESLAYLKSFYEIINDPDKLRRQIQEKCRGEKPSPDSAL
jgi:hypothetical protein